LLGLTMVSVMLIRPSGLWPSPRHEDVVHPHQPDADSAKHSTSSDKRLAA